MGVRYILVRIRNTPHRVGTILAERLTAAQYLCKNELHIKTVAPSSAHLEGDSKFGMIEMLAA